MALCYGVCRRRHGHWRLLARSRRNITVKYSWESQFVDFDERHHSKSCKIVRKELLIKFVLLYKEKLFWICSNNIERRKKRENKREKWFIMTVYMTFNYLYLACLKNFLISANCTVLVHSRHLLYSFYRKIYSIKSFTFTNLRHRSHIEARQDSKCLMAHNNKLADARTSLGERREMMGLSWSYNF